MAPLQRTPLREEGTATICPNTIMDGPRRRSRSAVLSPPPEVVAVEFDSSNPDSSRRPVVTYHVMGQDEGLVGQNSWNRVKRFQPSMSAFFRWEPKSACGVLCTFPLSR